MKKTKTKTLGSDTVSGCKRQGLVMPGTTKIVLQIPSDVTFAVRREQAGVSLSLALLYAATPLASQDKN